MSTELKAKHLEFVQTTIGRMANNSFLLKGWAVTIVGGLLALTFKEINIQYVYISLMVLFFFWLLDSYYLSRERHFIKLYDHTRQKKGETDFSMDTKEFRSWFDWLRCGFSRTMVLFYGGLAVVHLIVIHFI
jgi:hypothetical protein